MACPVADYDKVPAVIAVNRARRIALLDDDRTIPMTGFVGADGEETEDPADAVAAVAGPLHIDGVEFWCSLDLTMYDRKLH